jgi:hypothetical protein
VSEALASALADAGGVAAASERIAQLRVLAAAELARGRIELGLPRSGRDAPVAVLVAPGDRELRAVLPVDPAVRADPDAAPERAWRLAAATVGAMVEAGGLGPPAGADDLALEAGAWEGHLVLVLPIAPAGGDAGEAAELAVLALADTVDHIDRLRATAMAAPQGLLAAVTDLRPPHGSGHQLRVAEAAARLGANPLDGEAVDELEAAVTAILAPPTTRVGAHADPDPARRVARRILQRLDGMGKWGGYHTDFAHLSRGFAGNERALANEVGEALLAAGVLAEKPSVGQRHVFLNPQRSGDIRRFVDAGDLPAGLVLPRS